MATTSWQSAGACTFRPFAASRRLRLDSEGFGRAVRRNGKRTFDPISPLVASLGRHGANITGVTYVHEMLSGKSIELLKEAAPSVSRVAILWDPKHTDPGFRETERGSQALEISLQSIEGGMLTKGRSR